MSEELVNVPEAFQSIFQEDSDPAYDTAGRLVSPGYKRKRFLVRYGGRASGKSWQFAMAVVLRMYTGKEFVVCGRSVQKTMADSVHKLLVDRVEALGLRSFFEITDNALRVPHNGSSAIFKGVGPNSIKENLKSVEGATITWIEEADDVPDESWEILIPTVIRTPKSEIWCSFNTGLITDPTYRRFITEYDPERMDVRKVSFRDNPFLAEGVLEEMEALKKSDYDRYLHVWEGDPLAQKDGGVFKTENIKRVSAIPAGCRFVRGWDLASSAIRKGTSPDFTVGVKVGYDPATERYVVADVKRIQGTPDEVERLILTTAHNDGHEVQQSIPIDPGQAGKFQATYLAKKLAGYSVHSSLESGDKVTRAEPFASQCNVGNADVLEARWTDAYLSELQSFCGDPRLKDDQVDGSSRAFARLSEPRYMTKIRVF
jgi:predicted phage terminase large subunit-like protein